MTISLPIPLQIVLLLGASNVFMSFAWYGHLKHLADRPWFVAALLSWGNRAVRVPADSAGQIASSHRSSVSPSSRSSRRW
jgi:uncharacterized protein (DUF486 family)